jgi:hypothetical protein
MRPLKNWLENSMSKLGQKDGLSTLIREKSQN